MGSTTRAEVMDPVVTYSGWRCNQACSLSPARYGSRNPSNPPPPPPPPRRLTHNFVRLRVDCDRLIRMPPIPIAESQRFATMAVTALRAAKRRAAKKALTVALMVILTFPSLHAPRVSGGAGITGEAAGGASVEMMLPSSQSKHHHRQQQQQTGDSEVSRGSVRADVGAALRRRGGGGGRRAAASSAVSSSKAAFVGPWSSAEDRGSREFSPSPTGGVVATAVKIGKANKINNTYAKSATDESTLAKIQSVAESVTENGREIAVEFGGHIKVTFSRTEGFGFHSPYLSLKNIP